MLGFSLKEPKDRPKEEPDGSSFTLAFSIINGYGNIYLRRMSLIADFQEMEFPMTSLIRTGLLALVIIVVGAYSIASQAAEPLVGSWRLVSWVEVETESKSVHAPFGDNPSGMITYTTDGHEPTGLFDTSSNSHSGRGSIEPGVERGPVVVYNGDDVALRIAQPRQLLKQHDRHTVADQ
jgi:lipocalin-like protein